MKFASYFGILVSFYLASLPCSLMVSLNFVPVLGIRMMMTKVGVETSKCVSVKTVVFDLPTVIVLIFVRSIFRPPPPPRPDFARSNIRPD